VESLPNLRVPPKEQAIADRRSVNYRLTETGIDLAPVMPDLLIWDAKHEDTAAPCALIENMAKNRQGILADTRRKWQYRDRTPLLPTFQTKSAGKLRRVVG